LQCKGEGHSGHQALAACHAKPWMNGSCYNFMLLHFLCLMIFFFWSVCFILKSSWLDCRFNCHKRCAPKVPNNCLGEVTINGGREEVIAIFYVACQS
jgi:hypothetical protein